MSKFSRIPEIKATSTATFKLQLQQQEKPQFCIFGPVFCELLILCFVFCNVGWPRGGLCWIEWATLLLWPHNCDTRAVQTILHTDQLYGWCSVFLVSVCVSRYLYVYLYLYLYFYQNRQFCARISSTGTTGHFQSRSISRNILSLHFRMFWISKYTRGYAWVKYCIISLHNLETA